MTDAAILQQYEDFMDDQSTISQTLEIQLANNAKNKLETALHLEITKKLDTSNMTVIGGTYLTPYVLPTDWRMPNDTIYVGQDRYKQVPYERREIYRDTTGFFFIDFAGKNLYLCGTVAVAQIITIPYFFATPDITSASVATSGTTITWPSRFHTLISMEMAMMYYPIDAGDKNRAWDDRWTAAYNDLKSAFVAWDQQLKLAAIGGQTPYGDQESIPFSENRINFD